MKNQQDVNHVAGADFRSIVALSNATGCQESLIKVNGMKV